MNASSSINQAKMAASTGDTKKALVILREVIKQQPRNIDAWLLLAEVVDKPEQAQQCLERVLQIDPDHPVARQKLYGEPEPPPALDFEFGFSAEPEPEPIIEEEAPELDFSNLSFPEPVTPQPVAQSEIEQEPSSDTTIPQSPAPALVPEPATLHQPAQPKKRPAPKKRVQKKKKGLSRIEIAMISVIAFLCLCLGILGLATLGNSGALELEPTSLPEEVTAVVYDNIRASNNKDADGYMATLHPDSPVYNSTKNALEEAFSDEYDLSYKLSDVYIIEQSRSKAVVHFVLTTRLIRGPAGFRDNRVTGEMTLRKDDGIWKIYDQKTIDVEYLD